MKKMEKLLQEYVEKFSDNFPLFMVLSITDSEIIKILEDSIANNRKYNPEVIEGVVY